MLDDLEPVWTTRLYKSSTVIFTSCRFFFT